MDQTYKQSKSIESKLGPHFVRSIIFLSPLNSECDKTLSKIKSENARLQEQYKKLLGQVNEATIKKYGRLVNVTELEEAVLQALIHEVRMDVPDIIKSLDSDLKRKQVGNSKN